MTDSGGRTKHTVEQAMALQKRFEEDLARSQPGIVGVGISLNKEKDDLAINVQVDRSSVATRLPRQFDGIDVVVDVVGKIKAF
jgi:hypothetical protein